MNSQELRARLAQMEAEAESRARNQARAEADRWERAWSESGSAPREDDQASDGEAWPFEFLFKGNRSKTGGSVDDFFVSEWLFEGLRALRSYVRQAGLDDEFWRHMRASEREFLLAWRSLIDARLQRLEQREQAGVSGSERLQEIEIDFDDSAT